jgi:hypothetical protein
MDVLEAERLRDFIAWLEEMEYTTSRIFEIEDKPTEDGVSFKIRIWLRPKEKRK